VKRIGPVAQNVRRTAPDDDAIAPGGDILDHRVQHVHHAVRVEIFGFSEGEGAFVTAARVSFEKPVEEGIDSFVAAPGDLRIHIRGARDFRGDFLIPKLPAQPFGDLLRDVGAATSVFPLERDDAHRH
jgi:hypothetical protein